MWGKSEKRGRLAYFLAASVLFFMLSYAASAEYCVNPSKDISDYCSQELTEEDCCDGNLGCDFYAENHNGKCDVGCCYISGDPVKSCQGGISYRGLCTHYSGIFNSDENGGCSGLSGCGNIGCCCYTAADTSKASDLVTAGQCQSLHGSSDFHSSITSESECQKECQVSASGGTIGSTQCSDGIDNDFDGLRDVLDPDCLNLMDNSEAGGQDQCSDGIDNDGDGAKDSSDPCCLSGARYENICDLTACDLGFQAGSACSCIQQYACEAGQFCCSWGCSQAQCSSSCVPGSRRFDHQAGNCNFYFYCQNDGTWTSQAVKDPYCDMNVEICNNNKDDDKNGKTDCQEAKCANVVCTASATVPSGPSDYCQGLGYKDVLDDKVKCCPASLELSDCDNDGTKDTCGGCNCQLRKEAPTLVSVEKVSGEQEIRVRWYLDCDVQINIYRCEKNDGINCTEKAGFDAQNAMGLLAEEYLDSSIGSGTDYCYYVEAVYDEAPAGTELVSSDILCSGEIDPACMDAPPNSEFCIDENKGTSGALTVRAKCSGGRLNMIENCRGGIDDESDYSMICKGPDSNKVTKCVVQDPCDNCGRPFNMFSDYRQSTIFTSIGTQKNCQTIESCYFDSSATTIDKFTGCENIGGCYDYRTEFACTGQALGAYNNKCLLRDCEWVSLDGNMLDNGFCREKDGFYRSCEACNRVADAGSVFEACTAEKCMKFGDCFLSRQYLDYSQNRLCTDSEDISCNDYASEDECIGGSSGVEVDAGYSGVNRISGTNRITHRSDDILGIGLCRWDPGLETRCFKDADGNNYPDNYVHDTTPPVTTVLTSGKVKTLNFSAILIDPSDSGFGKSGAVALFYCLGKGCYPQSNGSYLEPDSRGIVSKDLGMASGMHTIRYYAVDYASNLEEVKEAVIEVDRTPPAITIGYSVVNDASHPYEDSKALFEIRVSEDAVCTDQMEGQQSKAINGNFGDFFQAEYASLSDGTYIYNMTCTDTAGNTGHAHVFVKVDADPEIHDAMPEGVINTTSPVLAVRTRKALTCTWARGTESGTFSRAPESGEYKHTSTYAGLSNNGVYSFRISCPDGSTSHYDEIQFVYDVSAPETKVVDSAGRDFDLKKWYGNTDTANNIIFLRCTDKPAFGFGCFATRYCTGSSRCAPDKTYSAGDPIEFDIDYGKETWLCYSSEEKIISLMGGLREKTVCNKVQIDVSPPVLFVNSLGSHKSPDKAYSVQGYFYTATGRVEDSDAQDNPNNKVSIKISSSSGFNAEYTAPANNLFSQQIELRPGINTVVISAVDRSGTANAGGPQTYYISMSEFNDTRIDLALPTNGVSDKAVFDFRIAAYMPMKSCRYSFLTSPSVSYDQYMDFDNKDKPQREGSTYYFTKSGINPCNSKVPCEVPVFVKCRDINGVELPRKQFNISWDPTAPVIKELYIDPRDDFDPNMITEPPLVTNLTAVTDDRARCRYSERPSEDFPSMSGFTGFGANTFTTLNTQPLSLEDETKYTYHVICENGAGKLTKKKSISFEVDTTIPGNMRFAVPNSTYSSNPSIRLKIQTNKDSESCTYGNSTGPETPMNKVSDRFHETAETLSLKEGMYSFYFGCMFVDGPYEKKLGFGIDLSPPLVPIVEDDDIWNYTDRLNANWSSSDNLSGIAEYVYAIGSRPGQADALNWTSTSMDHVTATGLNLSINSRYYWTVKAKNGAGLWSTPGFSKGVIVYDPLNSPIEFGCTDGFRNNDETDIDCGGPECDPCMAGNSCSSSQDCMSSVCKGSICLAANCTDNVRNQGESDVDCGGSWCAPCGLGRSCSRNSDCGSLYCSALGRCEEPSCDDGIKNGMEEGIDCGEVCSRMCPDPDAGRCTVDSSPDDDCDGMPDSWEKKYSLKLGIDDSGEDPDDDGFTNIDEYRNDTNPIESDSAGGRWWLWMLIIIALMGLVAGGGYYYYTEYYMKQQMHGTALGRRPAIQQGGRAIQGAGTQGIASSPVQMPMPQQQANPLLALRQKMLEQQRKISDELREKARKEKEEAKRKERESLLSKFDSKSGIDGSSEMPVSSNGISRLKEKAGERADEKNYNKKSTEAGQQEKHSGGSAQKTAPAEKQDSAPVNGAEAPAAKRPGMDKRSVSRQAYQKRPSPKRAKAPGGKPKQTQKAAKALDDLKSFASRPKGDAFKDLSSLAFGKPAVSSQKHTTRQTEMKKQDKVRNKKPINRRK